MEISVATFDPIANVKSKRWPGQSSEQFGIHASMDKG